LNISSIIELVLKVAEGEDSIKEGAVGYEGYGFAFKDRDAIERTFGLAGSGVVCRLGKTREILKDYGRKINVIENLDSYNEHYDILIAGSLKTLVPTLKFGGGYENLFEVWMLVKTPDNRWFPGTIYYGASGLSVGGWDLGMASRFIQDKSRLPILPPELTAQINCNPHKFTKDEKEGLSEAIELALRKVPVSDFYGVYRHDFGNSLMGVKNGVPLIVELGHSPNFEQLDLFLNKTLKLGIDKEEYSSWDY